MFCPDPRQSCPFSPSLLSATGNDVFVAATQAAAGMRRGRQAGPRLRQDNAAGHQPAPSKRRQSQPHTAACPSRGPQLGAAAGASGQQSRRGCRAGGSEARATSRCRGQRAGAARGAGEGGAGARGAAGPGAGGPGRAATFSFTSGSTLSSEAMAGRGRGRRLRGSL